MREPDIISAITMPTASQLPPPGLALPPDTLVAIQLLEVFRNPDHDLAVGVDFISQHPALVAETLRRCNSLRFRGAEQITDVFEAVSRMGFHELHSILSDALAAQGVQLDSTVPAELTWDDGALLRPPS